MIDPTTMLYYQIREATITLVSQTLGVAWRLQRPEPFPAQPESIVVIKPCCVGDVLLSTPLVATLRKAYPQARIDHAVGSWSRALLETNPHLSNVVDCGPVGSGPYFWADYRRLIERLRTGKYQAAFVLDRSLLISLLPWLAGIPHRVGLDSRGRGFSLTVRVPVMGIKHEAELYLDTARAVGISVAEPQLEFYPRVEDGQRVEGLLTGQVDAARRLVVIHPAGGKNPGMELANKRWPAERFAAVADILQSEAKVQVVLIGGPGDEAIARKVAEVMKEKPLDLTGRLTWGETGALFKRCVLFIGNDTGAMHLAVAVGTPTVAIFGPSDPRIYGPLGPKRVALWHWPEEGLPPLYQVAADPQYRQLIEMVSVEEVWEATKKLLG